MMRQPAVTALLQDALFQIGLKEAVVCTQAGSPVWKVAKPLSSHPPITALMGAAALCNRGNGSTKLNASLCRTSLSESPRCVLTLYASTTGAYADPEPAPGALM